MPLVWAGAIVTRARKEGRITSDYSSIQLLEKIDGFRSGQWNFASILLQFTLLFYFAEQSNYVYSAHWIYKPASVIRVAVAIGSAAALSRGWI